MTIPVASRASVWAQLAQAIVNRTIDLSLTGIDQRRVVIQKQIVDRTLTNLLEGLPTHVQDGSPACVVGFVTERNLKRLPNQIARREYGCVMALIRGHETDSDEFDKQLYWRQRVTDAFDQKPMPEVATIIKTVVEPGPIFPRALWRLGYDGQTLVIRGHSCERTT